MTGTQALKQSGWGGEGVVLVRPPGVRPGEEEYISASVWVAGFAVSVWLLLLWWERRAQHGQGA